MTVIESATTSPVRRWLNYVASRSEQQLAHYVGPEYSDLAMAVLLGARQRLDDTTMQSFLKTGTVHLLVVSGMHVGMLAGVIWFVVRNGMLPRTLAIATTAGLTIAYAAMAGGRPPVVRATILVALVLASLLASRNTSMKVLLAAAALVVLAYNPSELFRSGTQLGFLSVAALAGYGFVVDRRRRLDPLTRLVRSTAPWYEKTVRWLGRGFGHLAVASLVVWLVAAPLVAHHFHITTPISMVITPIVWPLVAGAFVAGLGICTVGWIFPPLAHLLGGACACSLHLTQKTVELAERFDLGHAYLPGPAVWWSIVFYAALALIALVPRCQIGWKPITLLATLWIAVGFAAAAFKSDDDGLRCTFLAVGHGTCVVLEMPGGQTVLYDAGSLDSPQGASRTIAAYLWSRGITYVDAVVLSHADVDHYNAMPGLLDRFDVGVVYVAPPMFASAATNNRLDAPNYLRTKLVEAGIPLREIWSKDRLHMAHPGLQVDVLHPPRAGVAGRDNANSILLDVQFAGHSVLLPGDLESPGIEAVMAKPARDCDILLAPHHGSSRSDPPGFAAWCTPDWVVVSGEGHQADVERTAASYRQVGADVLQTSVCGAIQFRLSSQRVEWTSYRVPDDRQLVAQEAP